MTFAFFEDLVRTVLVFILHVEHRIDEVFALQGPKAILPAETCEYRTVVEGGLAVQVQRRGPPGGHSVLKLSPVGVEVVAASLGTQSGEILDLEVAGFFQIVIISDEIRVLLGEDRRQRENQEYGKEEKAKQNDPTKRDHGNSLQMTCIKQLRLT